MLKVATQKQAATALICRQVLQATLAPRTAPLAEEIDAIGYPAPSSAAMATSQCDPVTYITAVISVHACFLRRLRTGIYHKMQHLPWSC